MIIKLTGLWKHTDKDGNLYLKGKVSDDFTVAKGQTLAIFKNLMKTNDNEPDFKLVLIQPELPPKEVVNKDDDFLGIK
jgi:hypothetical protein